MNIRRCALLWFLLLSAGIWFHGTACDAWENFTFALIGDIPRIGDKAIEPDLAPFMRLIEDINGSDVDFVVHVGDFKNGRCPCTDEVFERWYDLCRMFDMPFFYVYGDNEWTDCHREAAGGFDPLERLGRLRSMFHSKPYSLGGKRMPIERQSDVTSELRFEKYVENFRWTMENILFVGLNVQGSNNNLGRTPEMDAEYRERNEAVNTFLRESFALAKKNGNSAVVIAIQADPRFETSRNTDPAVDGYRDFRAVLEEETIAFGGKPVVLVHGDTHYFRIDKPLYDSKNGRRIENFTRVETFGTPDVHWVLATVDFSNPNLFVFEPRMVEGNIVDHLRAGKR